MRCKEISGLHVALPWKYAIFLCTFNSTGGAREQRLAVGTAERHRAESGNEGTPDHRE